MPFAHIYVKAPQDRVIEAAERHLAGRKFARFPMTSDRHPTRMKEIREDKLRLFWISPQTGPWTGVFEFRYYSNDARDRWGMSDEHLAIALSKELGEVWRLEVTDNAGFWLYAQYVGGEEKQGKAYHDTPGNRTADRSHPRYELNHIIDRERFANIGLGYEHIPGPQVHPIENVTMDPRGIEGLDGFVHLAFEKSDPS